MKWPHFFLDESDGRLATPGRTMLLMFAAFSTRRARRLAGLAALLIAAGVVGAGCGGGELDRSTPVPSTPAPNSLIGVDANGNGVRDDVDQAIAARYASAATSSVYVLTQLAQVHQSFLRDVGDPAALRADATALDRAIACVNLVQGSAATGDTAWERSQVFNTQERISAYSQAQRNLVGLILFAPTDISTASCTGAP